MQFYNVTVVVDHELDLTASVRVPRGSTIAIVKSELASYDPTGSTRIQDIGLRKCSGAHNGDVAPPLADEEIISEELLKLECCPVNEVEVQADRHQVGDSVNHLHDSNCHGAHEATMKVSPAGHAACLSAELPEIGSKLCVRVPMSSAPGRKRQVLVARLGEAEIVAMDNTCFHANGPLDQGDIEDIDGRICIVCPVHFYQFDLRTGEHIDEYCEVPVKRQRTHRAWESKGKVFVELDDSMPEMPSDMYADVDEFEDSDEDSDEESTSTSVLHPTDYAAEDGIEQSLPSANDDIYTARVGDDLD